MTPLQAPVVLSKAHGHAVGLSFQGIECGCQVMLTFSRWRSVETWLR
jgi:hypothetical protein